jgi:arylformamidase
MSQPTYNSEFCEQQYNARAAVPDHPAILARWAEESKRVREYSRCELDLAYGPSHREKLDLFLAEGTGRPLLLFIHGGYWRALDKYDFSFLAPAFTQAGVSVALASYGLCPQITIDGIVGQIRAAVAWLARNAHRYGAPANKLFVSGHSAGGHLTAMMAATHWPSFAADLPVDLVQGAVPISGIYDLEPLRYSSVNQDVRMNAAAARRLSPIHWRAPSRIPMVITAGGDESDEFKRQQRLLVESWRERCSFEEIPMPGHNHFSVVEQLCAAQSPLYHAVLRLIGVAA